MVLKNFIRDNKRFNYDNGEVAVFDRRTGLKRGAYVVMSYDDNIIKNYSNYGSACNYASKLTNEENFCFIYAVCTDEYGQLKYKMLIGY